MRKLILAAVLLAPLLGACQHSRDVLDQVALGSLVTVTTHDGQAVSGRLVQTRLDAVVVQPANSARATVARKDVASVTIPTARVAEDARQAPAGGTSAPPPGPSQANGEPAGTVPGPAPSPAPTPHAEGVAASSWREIVVPTGTHLAIRLNQAVGSDISRPEEPVHATLVRPVVVKGVTAVPAGSAVSGTVTRAKRSGRVRGVAQLAVRFDTVTPPHGGEHYRVRTGIVARRAPTTHKKDALTIGAPAAGGAILGGLLGGKKGALIGTTVGGAAGTAVVLTTRGKEVRLPRGAVISIKLLEPMTVRVPA